LEVLVFDVGKSAKQLALRMSAELDLCPRKLLGFGKEETKHREKLVYWSTRDLEVWPVKLVGFVT
jgi:phage-related protein